MVKFTKLDLGVIMKDESFVKLFFEKAKERSEQFTQNGNIMCSNGKNISRDKVKGIFELRGVIYTPVQNGTNLSNNLQ